MCVLVLIAYISYSNPVMWAGSALAVFPIAAHLLNRYARGRRVFPSLMLLHQAVVQQHRIRKLRRRILLVLRCLIVLAIAAAFSRPVWQESQGAAFVATQPHAAVLLIDASASMQVRRGGVPLFEIAQAEADRILSDLRQGTDVASVIFVASTPFSIFQELSANLAALKDELPRYEVTQERADALAGLELAGQTLRNFKGLRRIIIISDLQAISWKGLCDSQPSDRVPTGTRVSVVDLDVPAGPNVSIHSPRSDPRQPLVGQSMTLAAQLQNHSDLVRQVRVTARVDQNVLGEFQVALEPGRQRDVSFDTSWTDRTIHEVVFEIDHDVLDVDDQCFWVARARAQIPVIVVNDDALRDARSAGYYLSRALAPHQSANDRFAITRMTSRELATAKLSRRSAVFVADVGLLEKPAARRLHDYVQNGGACVVLCGQGPVRRNLLRLDEVSSSGCLPWVPGARQDVFGQGQTRRITSGRWRAPLLREFDETSQIALGRIRFGQVFRAERVRAEADVLLSFDDRTPALATRSIGKGVFVVANFSPDDPSSDLGRHGAFVALMQILAQNLRPDEPGGVRLIVGQPINRRLLEEDVATNVIVTDPRGKPVRSKISVDGTTTEVTVASGTRSGFYRVRRGRQVVDVVAVNVDPSESNLTTVPVDEVRTALAGSVGIVESVGTDDWKTPVDVQGRPLWGYLILSAMALIGCELALLGWWRR